MLDFYCPFPKRIHPSAARARIRSMRWMRSHALFEHVKDPRRFERNGCAMLAARIVPGASDELLQLVADWTTWSFVLGDIFDESPIGKSPPKTRAFIDRVVATLYQQGTLDDGITTALSELCSRFAALGGQVGLARFAGHVVEYLEACLWKAENRACGATPPLAVFEVMRSYSGAARTYLDLAEIAAGVSLPCLVRQHPTLQRANLAVCNIDCWNKDALSLANEGSGGDSHNLVWVLAAELGMPIDVALDAAVASCNAEVRVLERMVDDPPHFGSEAANDMARRYLHALTELVRGAIDWMTEAARYRESKTAA
jgi:hypothetical protein